MHGCGRVTKEWDMGVTSLASFTECKSIFRAEHLLTSLFITCIINNIIINTLLKV